MALNKTGNLAIGPVLYNWQPEIWRDFYFRIADEAPVDIVYLGEVICAKRWPFYIPFLADIVERLQSAGKQVVFSTLALVMNKYEREAVRAIAADHDLQIEVNDISALTHLENTPHVIGPFINCYNEETLAFFARKGASRICLPIELSRRSIAILAEQADRLPMETEVMAYGRMPLAVSARCYHARVHKLSKDSCQFVCNKDPDGLSLETLDSESFLTINGIATMSHACLNLLGELRTLADAGVSTFRLSPQSADMVQVADLFDKVLKGAISAQEASHDLGETGFEASFSNGYIHEEPGVNWIS